MELLDLQVKVLAEYPHDPQAFTQGLLWHGERLYESTGLHGSSSLRRVALETGEVELRLDLPQELFGEGLARVGERLVQLTWQKGVVRLHQIDDFELVGERRYAGEGWGVCFDGKQLVRSDGSATLTFHDSESFAELRSQEVTLAGVPVRGLNELECAEGWIYANVYQTDFIVRIDGANGEIRARIDASSLLPERAAVGAGVLNGIAYREETASFLVTGKRWPKIYEVIFVSRE